MNELRLFILTSVLNSVSNSVQNYTTS